MTAAAESKSRSEVKEVRRVLVLEHLLALGSAIHTTPVFEAIKRSRPDIQIAVATRSLALQVLRHSPFIDHLIETPDPNVRLIAAVLSLRSQLRRRGFRPDCVLTGVPDQRTRIALLALFGSSGWRGGYTQAPRLYRKPLVYDQNLSQIGNNLRLATLVSCLPEPAEPRVPFSTADAEKAANLLQTANPEARPVCIMVTQNSGGQSTGWHTSRFVQVIRHAALELGLAVVYVGVAQDSAAIEAIRSAAGGIGVSLAGSTAVTELAAVLALSDYAVTLDTGTMHVGRAVDLPMVILAPSWQKPTEWMPLGRENVRILRGPDRESVPAGYRLDEISPESVIAALGELVKLYPALPEARERRREAGLSSVDHLGDGQFRSNQSHFQHRNPQ
jgi:ADP-heptose:LPS heptosyltransferase